MGTDLPMRNQQSQQHSNSPAEAPAALACFRDGPALRCETMKNLLPYLGAVAQADDHSKGELTSIRRQTKGPDSNRHRTPFESLGPPRKKRSRP